MTYFFVTFSPRLGAMLNGLPLSGLMRLVSREAFNIISHHITLIHPSSARRVGGHFTQPGGERHEKNTSFMPRPAVTIFHMLCEGMIKSAMIITSHHITKSRDTGRGMNDVFFRDVLPQAGCMYIHKLLQFLEWCNILHHSKN